MQSKEQTDKGSRKDVLMETEFLIEEKLNIRRILL